MKIGQLFKIILMAIALIVVFRGIGFLRSDEFLNSAKNPNSFVNLFVGGNQSVFNWCPPGLKTLTLVGDSMIFETPQDFALLCELMISPFEQPQEELVFKPFIKASGESEVILEKAEGQAVYRAQGMPFSSPGLEVHIKRILAE